MSESPFGRFPESWAYRLSPASDIYHQVEDRHPLWVTIGRAVAFFSLLVIGGIILDFFGWMYP